MGDVDFSAMTADDRTMTKRNCFKDFFTSILSLSLSYQPHVIAMVLLKWILIHFTTLLMIDDY